MTVETLEGCAPSRPTFSTRVSCHKIDMDDTPEQFNGLQLSESVLAREWNSPQEDAAWADI
jgi:hypothetical protein